LSRLPAAPPPRRGPRRFALPVVALGLALGLGEAALRVADYPPTVPPYEMSRTHLVRSDVPGVNFELKPGVPGFSNNRGCRNAEDFDVKPPGEKRVLVLGDSVTFNVALPRAPAAATFEDRLRAFGHEVSARDLERLYTRVCEKELRRAGSVRVINLSLNGYSLRQERSLFERRGLAFEPDVCVVAFNENDLRETPVFMFDNTRRPRLRLLRLWRRAVREDGPPEGDDWAEGGAPWRRAVADVRELRDLCARRGVRLVFLILPHLTDTADQPHKTRLAALLNDLGVPWFYPYDAFREAGLEACRAREDPTHYSPAGHEVLGRYLARRLEASL
jgi:lysophospholipase L1-like esterase